MNLDLHTVIFFTAVSAFIMGGGTLATARSYSRHIQGIPRWTFACLSQGVAWMMLGDAEQLPRILSIVVANSLLVASLALAYHALREFKSEYFKKTPVYAVAIVVFVTFLYYTYINPDAVVRMVVASLALAILSLGCAQVLLDERQPRQPFSYWMTGLGFLACGLGCVIRVIFIVRDERLPEHLLDNNVVQNLTYSLGYVVVLVVNFGFVLMCSDKFNAELQRLATLDPLTGSFNRGTIDILMDKEFKRARRLDNTFTLLVLDLDHFKTVNDTYGHSVGDDVLRKVIEITGANLRAHDSVGRFGGEEFVVLLPHTSIGIATVIAERLRTTIEQAELSLDHPALRCTTSIGVAELRADDEGVANLFERADKALYQAKARGRNRTMAGEAAAEPKAAAVPTGAIALPASD